MILGRRVSDESKQRLADDTELAGTYSEVLDAARAAERDLRSAQAQGRPYEELRELGDRFDTALTDALYAAEAAERVAMGARAYEDRIARRKARARTAVRPWIAEVDRLRTLREEHRINGTLRVVRRVA